MIEISKLKKGSHILKFYSNGEVGEFIVRDVRKDSEYGWVANVDWADDDYSKDIVEADQDKYEYGRRRNDRRPRYYKEIKEEQK